MRILVDTHTLLCILQEPKKLSKPAINVITNPAAEVFVSVASFWEIAIKVQLGKMLLEDMTLSELPPLVRASGIKVLRFDEHTCCESVALPKKQNHKDPFDRMIIWQAISGGFILLSRDSLFDQYVVDGLDVRW